MRWTMRSRLSIAGGPFLDALGVAGSLDDAFHEDARRVDAVGLEIARVNELLDLGNRVPGRGRHHRVEVSRRLAIDEIAAAIAPPRLDEREVGMQRRLEYV